MSRFILSCLFLIDQGYMQRRPHVDVRFPTAAVSSLLELLQREGLIFSYIELRSGVIRVILYPGVLLSQRKGIYANSARCSNAVSAKPYRRFYVVNRSISAKKLQYSYKLSILDIICTDCGLLTANEALRFGVGGVHVVRVFL